MSYTVHSQMMIELTPFSPRLLRHVTLCRVWRGFSWLLLPLCYLGALIAPAMVLSIPFQYFHRHEVSPLVFWPVTAVTSALVLYLFYRAATYSLHNFRQRVIHVEAIVICVALVLAVIAITLVFPPK